MTAPIDRREALYRVGRNLLNFQKLEHALKLVLPRLSVASPISEVANAYQSKGRELKNRTLGHLTHALDATLFKPHIDPEPDSLPEPFYSFSLKLDLTSEHKNNYKKKWKDLLKSRNDLIHHQLVRFDLESTEDCTQLCKELDEQNLKICDQFQELMALVSSIEEAHKTILQELVEPDQSIAKSS